MSMNYAELTEAYLERGDAIERLTTERDEALDALGRIGGVLFMHSHADTCAMELSPNAGYECSCWRAGIYAALGVKP